MGSNWADMRMLSEIEHNARASMKKHGLAPKDAPNSIEHHTDVPFSMEDVEIAELAFWLGSIFVDKEGDDSTTELGYTYWGNEMTSVDVWKRVARALRVHGLKIVNRE